MSKKEKLFEKMKNNPKNVRFEALRNILLGLGFIERQSRKGTSHYVYTKDDIILTIPKKTPLNQIYVMEALDAIERVLQEQEEE
ncbi:hypothetical protein EDC14_1004170 [Hydrogenispora ethanolica]|uniref:HicA-like toxin of HicAB toxin-antitoxin system n=1 Tax=Hydrogenispora ethanolica TaxID=1082276 RepID=A0A4R1S6Z2_HYDET|nr:toxin HicA [Hydrogenispora ethanolica]TCL74232.1 hypothetical protein EDC14_1004170 [Hydrogenispora ethanolica]